MRIKSQTTFVAGMLLVLGIVMIAMPVGMIYGTSAEGPVPGGVWIPQMGLPITLPLPEFGLGSTRGRKATVEWKLSVKIPDDATTHEMEFEIPINAVGKRPQDAAESRRIPLT